MDEKRVNLVVLPLLGGEYFVAKSGRQRHCTMYSSCQVGRGSPEYLGTRHVVTSCRLPFAVCQLSFIRLPAAGNLLPAAPCGCHGVAEVDTPGCKFGTVSNKSHHDLMMDVSVLEVVADFSSPIWATFVTYSPWCTVPIVEGHRASWSGRQSFGYLLYLSAFFLLSPDRALVCTATDVRTKADI